MKQLNSLLLILVLIFIGCQKQVDINDVQITDISGDERVDFDEFLKGVNGSFLLSIILTDDKPYFLHDGELFSGQIVQHLLDGTLLRNYNVRNGLLDGLNQEFNNDGNLSVKANFSNGSGNGRFQVFHKNGQLFEEGNLNNNKIEGEYKSFFENGAIHEEGSYENNQRVGVWEFFNENESLIKRETYEFGVKQGKVEHFENDVLVREEEYKDGELHGVIKIYDQNGEFLEEQVYEYGYRVDLRIINIIGTDDMKFAVEENQRGVNTLGRSGNRHFIRSIEVSPNEEFSIEMTTKSNLPPTAMSHNLVLVKRGTNLDQFARSSITARNNNYIAPDFENSIIANTKMLGNEETDLITIIAPDEPGEYDIICTFPGHYAGGMTAKLIVR